MKLALIGNLDGERLHRAAAMAETTVDRLLEQVEVIDFPHASKKQNRERADAILPQLAGRRAILFGSHVAAAFGYGSLAPYLWRDKGSARIAVCPAMDHRAKAWIDPRATIGASTFLKAAVEGRDAPTNVALNAGRRTGEINGEERRARMDRYVDALSQLGNVKFSAMHAGVAREVIFRWQEEDEEFRSRCKEAAEDYCDRIRNEYTRRALVGIEVPVIYQGANQFRRNHKGEFELDAKGLPIPLTVREYSDELLRGLARAHLSEFKEVRRFEHAGLDGKPIQHEHRRAVFDTSKLSDAQLRQLDSLLALAYGEEDEAEERSDAS